MIGSNEFLKFHKSIIDLLETSKLNVVYVLRHNYVPLSDLSSENKVTLSGYGVELDIKSTEYKAKDDAKVNADTSSESTTDQTANNVEEESIQGFNFKKLKQFLILKYNR